MTVSEAVFPLLSVIDEKIKYLDIKAEAKRAGLDATGDEECDRQRPPAAKRIRRKKQYGRRSFRKRRESFERHDSD
jgi:hypothetical protein